MTPHRLPNKMLLKMLDQYFMYECGECERGWLLDEFKEHKDKGFCVMDPTAENHIPRIKYKA